MTDKINGSLPLVNTYKVQKGQVDAANKNMVEQLNYKTLGEIQAAGLLTDFNDIHKGLLDVDTHNIALKKSGVALSAESEGLNDIKKAITEFKHSIPEINPRAGTIAEKADKALKTIQQILTKQAGGKYVFGGNSPEANPLQADLVSTTNLINGKASNNYSNSTSNKEEISISSAHKVPASMVHAGMAEIAGYIGALNQYKAGDTPDAMAAMQKAEGDFDKLHMKVNIVIKEEIKAAEAVNSADFVKLQDEYNSSFKETDMIKLTTNVKDAQQALMMSFMIQEMLNRISDQIFKYGTNS